MVKEPEFVGFETPDPEPCCDFRYIDLVILVSILCLYVMIGFLFYNLNAFLSPTINLVDKICAEMAKLGLVTAETCDNY